MRITFLVLTICFTSFAASVKVDDKIDYEWKEAKCYAKDTHNLVLETLPAQDGSTIWIQVASFSNLWKNADKSKPVKISIHDLSAGKVEFRDRAGEVMGMLSLADLKSECDFEIIAGNTPSSIRIEGGCTALGVVRTNSGPRTRFTIKNTDPIRCQLPAALLW